jgi:hypothetical protein
MICGFVNYVEVSGRELIQVSIPEIIMSRIVNLSLERDFSPQMAVTHNDLFIISSSCFFTCFNICKGFFRVIYCVCSHICFHILRIRLK